MKAMQLPIDESVRDADGMPAPSALPDDAFDDVGESPTTDLFDLPMPVTSIFSPPEPLFGSPVIDPNVPAPPPIEVGAEPFEDVQLESPLGEGARPLVAPRPGGDFTSEPLYMRETTPDQAICRSCTKCMESMVAKPVRSQTFTPLQISLQCTAIRGKLLDVTEAVVFHCSFYEQDAGRVVVPFRELAAQVRGRFGLTAPPPVRKAP